MCDDLPNAIRHRGLVAAGDRGPRGRAALLLAGIVVAFAGLLPTVAAGATLSMPEFLALKPQWEELAKSGERLRLEGRIESASPQFLRLKHCPLDFRPAEKVLPEVDLRAVTVEITGRFGRRNTKLVFIVSEMTEPPSDADVFELRESALDVDDPADWFELADWAADRGEFYDDKYLLAKANEARRRGLSVARAAAAGDATTLDKLAAQAERFGLVDTQRMLWHESLRASWQKGKQDSKSDLAALAEQITARLPGAKTRLPKWNPDLAAKYAANPIAVYDAADGDERAILERVFFASVQQAAIERQADPAGANGDQIADRLAAALPERPSLADAYREREIAYRMQRIDQATRSEATALADRLNASGRGAEAKQALVAWLDAREEAARRDGSTAELMRVAEDYAGLLGDRETAARLLIELLKQSPDSEEIPARLRQLGYVDFSGEWITRAAAATRPVDPVMQAMREGRVTVNMSHDQVRKTLGKPDRVSRAAGSTQIHEVWVYGESGRSGLAVHFLRYAARGSDAARVVDVATLLP